MKRALTRYWLNSSSFPYCPVWMVCFWILNSGFWILEFFAGRPGFWATIHRAFGASNLWIAHTA